MFKKSLAAALLAAVVLAVPPVVGPLQPTAFAESGIRVEVDGLPLKLTAPAYKEGKTTLVPLRQIADALEASVTWKKTAAKSTVTLKRGDRTAVLTVGSALMQANGREVRLDAAVQVRGSVTMVPVRAISEALGAVVSWDGFNKVVHIGDPTQLPVIGTVKKLNELLAQSGQSTGIYDKGGIVTAMPEAAAGAADGAEAPQAAPSAERNSLGGSVDQSYSETNVQVQGVDEADWAKTDGRFIYQLSANRVFISDIADPTAPKLAATLEYPADQNFYPQEIYVDDGRLIVIGQSSVQMIVDPGPPAATEGSPAKDVPAASPASAPASSAASAVASAPPEAAGASSAPDAPAARSGGGSAGNVGSTAASSDAVAPALELPAPVDGKRIGIMPYYPTRTTVVTKIYALEEGGQPKLTRETELEGNYVSSRKIDSSVYIVTNKYNYNYYYYPMMDAAEEGSVPPSEGGGSQSNDQAAADSFEPMYKDTAASDDGIQQLPLDSIRYFPESADTSTMLIGAFDLDRPEQEMEVSAYLGSGQSIYASTKHLYVAISKYTPSAKGETYTQTTEVHKFRLDQGKVVYIGKGTVPGTILNQFSMDENEGYFRIATTNGNMWSTGADISTNNLYVLDEQLQTVGKLEGLAPGERIYSVRFMGGRAYMVTFRNVDPLFAIDLRNPASPALLGQLKIPGYSDYLHPYDENHLIGFGKETVELPSKGAGPDATMAFYQGMKIAIFDVTDVSQPKEKFKEIIGDRGTGSELLYNHKALLFNKASGLMAFPVDLMEVTDKDKANAEANGFPAYGQFVYQGAYVYHVDMDTGFTLRGRITHLSDEDLSKSGQYGYDYSKTVRRILYAGDTLYTLSDSKLKANDLNNLGERGTLDYPKAENIYGGGYVDGQPVPMPAVSEPMLVR